MEKDCKVSYSGLGRCSEDFTKRDVYDDTQYCVLVAGSDGHRLLPA